MNIVISKDGTRIAYEKSGSGSPLILVDGALCSRTSGPNGALAAHLMSCFTVYTYDRRGRGDSGEATPYHADREVEDISALIQEAGGSAFVYGISSGAALVLEAAKQLPGIKKAAVYEAPFVVDGSRPSVPAQYLAKMQEMLASDRRGSAIKLFMKEGVRVPGFFVAIMPMMPAWPKLKALAHTLPYDTLLTIKHQDGKPFQAGLWSGIQAPVLVAAGGKSPQWMRNAMLALSEALPNASHQLLEGQTHMVKPAALAPMLIEFFENGDKSVQGGKAG